MQQQAQLKSIPEKPMMISVSHRRNVLQLLWQYRYLYLLALPGILTLLVFHYLPIPGIAIAFQDYSPVQGIAGSEWIGFQNFERLFNDPQFWRIFRNSILLSIATLVLVFPAPIILALMLNELTSGFFKRTMQTIYYLPHFLSWVIVASLTYIFFSTEIGVVNKAIVEMGGTRIPFLLRDEYFYPTIILQNIWKEMGWGRLSIWRQSLESARNCMRRRKWTVQIAYSKSVISPCPALCPRLSSCWCFKRGALNKQL